MYPTSKSKWGLGSHPQRPAPSNIAGDNSLPSKGSGYAMHVCIRFNTISIYTIYRLKNYSETKKDSSETKKDSSETKNYSETKKQFFGLVTCLTLPMVYTCQNMGCLHYQRCCHYVYIYICPELFIYIYYIIYIQYKARKDKYILMLP